LLRFPELGKPVFSNTLGVTSKGHKYISSDGMAGAEDFSFLGFSATIASVVMRRPARDAAF